MRPCCYGSEGRFIWGALGNRHGVWLGSDANLAKHFARDVMLDEAEKGPQN